MFGYSLKIIVETFSKFCYDWLSLRSTEGDGE